VTIATLPSSFFDMVTLLPVWMPGLACVFRSAGPGKEIHLRDNVGEDGAGTLIR
jgi:hypothetical protein